MVDESVAKEGKDGSIHVYQPISILVLGFVERLTRFPEMFDLLASRVPRVWFFSHPAIAVSLPRRASRHGVLGQKIQGAHATGRKIFHAFPVYHYASHHALSMEFE